MEDYYVINSENKDFRKKFHDLVQLLRSKGYKKIMKEYRPSGYYFEYYKKKKNKEMIVIVIV